MPRWKNHEPEKGIAEIRPALFLDRDGVLIFDKNYLSDPSEVELVPGLVDALKKARDAGYLLIGVSNQSGIGRGKFTISDLDKVMDRFYKLMAEGEVSLDAFYYCPHAPEQNCDCRKPEPGLLREATEHFNWNADKSWVIGDKLSDVQFGRDAGLKSVLVRTGHGLEHVDECLLRYGSDDSVVIMDNLPIAVQHILDLQDEGSDL